MLLQSCGSTSSVARQSSKPCAKGLIVIRHSLTVFSRLVSRRRPLSLAPFVKRWPDLSELSLIRFIFLNGLMTVLPRHIIQELQKESANAAHQNKLLESENNLLLSETEQLRKVIFLEH